MYLVSAIEKYILGHYEFDVPKKLNDLYSNKDYKIYYNSNKTRIYFTAANRTTG